MRITEYRIKKNQKAQLELVKERSFNHVIAPSKLNNPEEIAKLLYRAFELESEPEEHVMLVTMNNAFKPNGVFEVARGSYNACTFDVKSILARVLLTGASAFAVAHNHPSGSLEPSNEDIEITKKIRDAANVVGLVCVDHIILANGNHNSLMLNGYV